MMSEQYDDIFDYDEDKPKRKVEDRYTWSDAFQSIGIFAGMILLSGVISVILQQVFLKEQLETYNEILGASSPDNPMVGAFSTPMQSILLLVVGLVLSALVLLFVYGVVHLIATKALNGVGSYPGIIYRTKWWNAITYAVYSVFVSLYSLYMVNRLVEMYGDNLPDGTGGQFQNDLLQLVYPIYIIMGIAWLVWVIGVSMVTSEHYHMTKVRGCVTMALSHLVFAALYCGLSIVVGILLFSAFSSSSTAF